MEKGKKKITEHPIDNISRQKKFRTLPQSNALGKEKSHNTTTQQHSGKEKKLQNTQLTTSLAKKIPNPTAIQCSGQGKSHNTTTQ